MDTDPGDLPRSLRDPTERARRRAMLELPHMAPLAAYAQGLRPKPGVEVQDFDPCDGGTRARILFLLEKPGPMTSPTRPGRRGGSGFISRDNDDPTAEAIHRFMRMAGLDRRDTVIWNAVPWWNGTTAILPAERADGAVALQRLLPLLPGLRTVVMVGKTAARVRANLAGYRLLESAHPSPQVRAAFPDRWNAIPEIWRQAVETD